MRIIRYPLFDEPLTVGPAETLANDASRVGMQQHFPFSVFLFFFCVVNESAPIIVPAPTKKNNHTKS
jgi:hypothetical protein